MSVIATCSAGLSSILSFFILCASTIFKVAVATKIAETAIDAYQIELLKITETNESPAIIYSIIATTKNALPFFF